MSDSGFQCVMYLSRTPTAGLLGVWPWVRAGGGQAEAGDLRSLVPGVFWGLLPGLVLINAMHWGSRVAAFSPQESEELLPSLAKLLTKMRRLPSHIYQPIINSFPHFLLIMAHQPEL